ncbi:MAG: hypothetical protein ACKVVT_04470 [Dehalococcoidia bacterium]
MHILVLGHSDSAGNALPEGSEPWPVLLKKGLEAGGALGSVTLSNRSYAPLADPGLGRLEGYLQEQPPDLVIVSPSWFPFLIRTVKSRLRARWGKRAVELARRVELRFDDLTLGRRIGGRRANALGRRMARRLLGTAPISSYERTMEKYDAVMRRLSRLEDVPVIVQVDLGPASRLHTPQMTKAMGRFATDIAAMAVRYRFHPVPYDEGLSSAERDATYLPDGIHRTPEKHETAAKRLLEVARAALAGQPTRQLGAAREG